MKTSTSFPEPRSMQIGRAGTPGLVTLRCSVWMTHPLLPGECGKAQRNCTGEAYGLVYSFGGDSPYASGERTGEVRKYVSPESTVKITVYNR